MEKHDYVRTDLAAESPVVENGTSKLGVEAARESDGPCSLLIVNVTSDEGAKAVGRPKGTYITVSFQRPWLMSDGDLELTTDCLSRSIRRAAPRVFDKPTPPSVLIAGLGNRYITSDAIGPLTLKSVNVTRHLKTHDKQLFSKLNTCSVSAITPGVLGQTGIETFRLIKNAVDSVAPDLLIVIDALAAKSVDRLATTVQICNTGIAPGSGIGNKRTAINRETMGVPVIAIGVPTMVDSSTLVYDALEKAGVSEISKGLRAVLDNGKSFFVTLNDSDTAVLALSDLISKALNKALAL